MKLHCGVNPINFDIFAALRTKSRKNAPIRLLDLLVDVTDYHESFTKICCHIHGCVKI
jgi:hypothetical protein